MIRCLDEIAEQVRRSLNLSLTGAQIENVLRGSPDSMDDRVKAIIQREAGSFMPAAFSLPLPKQVWTAAPCRLYFSAAGPDV